MPIDCAVCNVLIWCVFHIDFRKVLFHIEVEEDLLLLPLEIKYPPRHYRYNKWSRYWRHTAQSSSSSSSIEYLIKSHVRRVCSLVCQMYFCLACCWMFSLHPIHLTTWPRLFESRWMREATTKSTEISWKLRTCAVLSISIPNKSRWPLFARDCLARRTLAHIFSSLMSVELNEDYVHLGRRMCTYVCDK